MVAVRDKQKYASKDLTTFEASVLPFLSGDPLMIEDLVGRTRLPRADVKRAIDGLVAKGVVDHLPCGSGYALQSGRKSGRKPKRGRLRREDVIEEMFALLVGDAKERLRILSDGVVDMMMMSPPYYKERDYGAPGQIGWEATEDDYVARLIGILAECSRVLAPHGLIFFVFDDHVDRGRQAGIDSKIVTQLHKAGLEKFREIIWLKNSTIPNGTDNAPAHRYEKICVFKKIGASHYWDPFLAREDAKEGGSRRLGDVWDIPVSSRSHHASGKHYATFPLELVDRAMSISTSEKGYCSTCGAPWKRVIERGVTTWRQHGLKKRDAVAVAKKLGKAHANCAVDGNGKRKKMRMADMSHAGWRRTCHHKSPARRALIVDPFVGSGSTGIVAVRRGYEFLGIDINPKYVKVAAKSIRREIAKSELSEPRRTKKSSRASLAHRKAS